MDKQLTREETCIRHVEQINALIAYVRKAGFNALNEYQKDKMLNLTTRQGIMLTTAARLCRLHGGGVTLSPLARELHMSVSAASHLVDSLEEQNLLERHADEENRRNVRITLSAAGQQCADIARENMLKAIRALTSQLTPEEEEMRLRIIDKCYRAAFPDTP